MTIDSGTSGLLYRGRSAKRYDSRQRRKAILEAALRLIVRDGIRGIRHRAVAREAGVPLAATTYYFKGLNDLISDSFTYFVELGLQHNLQLQKDSLAAARSLSGEELASGNGRRQLTRQLTRFVLAHVRNQASDRNRRLIELTFRNETLHNPQLASAMRAANRATEQLIQEFFQLLGLTDPEAAAQIAHGTILNLEYQLLSGAIAVDSPLLERTVTMMVKSLIPATLSVAEVERQH